MITMTADNLTLEGAMQMHSAGLSVEVNDGVKVNIKTNIDEQLLHTQKVLALASKRLNNTAPF